MYLRFKLAVSTVILAVSTAYAASASNAGEPAGAPQIEIWLGNQRVERPRLHSAPPPRFPESGSKLNAPTELGWASERQVESSTALPASRVDGADPRSVEQPVDTPAAFLPHESFMHLLEPLGEPPCAARTAKLEQARRLLTQSIELAQQAEVLLRGEATMSPCPSNRDGRCPTGSASSPRQLEAIETSAIPLSAPAARVSAQERPVTGEQAISPLDHRSNAALLSHATAAMMTPAVPSPGASRSGLTYPSTSAISPAAVRTLKDGGQEQHIESQSAGLQASAQRTASGARQATLVAPPQFDAKFLVALLVTLLALLAVMQFGGGLRRRIGGQLAELGRRLRRHRRDPAAARARTSEVESAGPEQALLAAVLAHNLRLRGSELVD